MDDFNMYDFIHNARFRTEPQDRIIAEYKGQDYDVVPDGHDYVRIMGPDGETLGRMTFARGQFVPA